jgi:hypothetical protein
MSKLTDTQLIILSAASQRDDRGVELQIHAELRALIWRMSVDNRLGTAVIAAAILVTNHWQVVPTQESLVALRLNRWTGLVEVCMYDLGTQRDPKSLAGVELACRAK